MYRPIGQYTLALARFQEALAIARELGDRIGEGIALNNIGETVASLGRLAETHDCLVRALAINREVGNRISEQHSLIQLGNLHLLEGATQPALGCYRRPDHRPAAGQPHRRAAVLDGLGRAARSLLR